MGITSRLYVCSTCVSILAITSSMRFTTEERSRRMMVWALGIATTPLGFFVSGAIAWATSSGAAYLSLTIWVMNWSPSGICEASIFEKGVPSVGAEIGKTAFTNFSPCEIIVIPFNARTVLSAWIASSGVNGVNVLIVIWPGN